MQLEICFLLEKLNGHKEQMTNVLILRVDLPMTLGPVPGDRASAVSGPCGDVHAVKAVPGPGGSGSALWYGLAV